MIRSEALKAAKYHPASAAGTKTGKFSLLYFPADCEITQLLDSHGNDVTTEDTGGGAGTTLPGGTTLAREEGDYYSSFTIADAGVNYVNA